jgi:hypothetical protein
MQIRVGEMSSFPRQEGGQNLEPETLLLFRPSTELSLTLLRGVQYAVVSFPVKETVSQENFWLQGWPDMWREAGRQRLMGPVAIRYIGNQVRCSRTPPHPLFIDPILLEALDILARISRYEGSMSGSLLCSFNVRGRLDGLCSFLRQLERARCESSFFLPRPSLF